MQNVLSNVDLTWLRMEESTNPMMISVLLLFDEPVPFTRLKETLTRRLLSIPRMRQRVVSSWIPILGKPKWSEDPAFDLHNHLERVSLPAPGDRRALERFVGERMSRPLDRSRPLWKVHLIENFEGGSAILFRIHHAIADGIALMFLLLAMADVASEAEKNADPEENPLTRLFEEGNLSAEAAGRLVEDTLHREIEGVITQERALASERGGGASLTTLSRMVLRWPDPQTIFKGPLGPRKLAAWSDPIELDQAEAIAETWGGSVDALLLSAVCGALRNDLLRQEEVVEDLEFRAALPVNLRSWERMPALGNRLGIVFLSLPIGISDPRERFEEIGRRMAALRASPEAIVSFRLFQTIGTSPAEIREMLLQNIGAKTTLVLTNVPGPRFPVVFAGKEVKGIVFWVPHIGRVALGIDLFTYAGKIRLSLSTDAGIVPEPRTIVEAFHDVFDEMRKALLSPPRAEAQEREVPTDTVSGKDDFPGEETTPLPPPTGEGGERENRCAARTRRGTRCKNPPRPGSPFCFTHRALSGATKPSGRGGCQARTKAGRPCRNRARPGSSFCTQHTPPGG